MYLDIALVDSVEDENLQMRAESPLSTSRRLTVYHIVSVLSDIIFPWELETFLARRALNCAFLDQVSKGMVLQLSTFLLLSVLARDTRHS